MDQQIGGEDSQTPRGPEETPRAPEEDQQREAAEVVELNPRSQVVDEQFELDLLMKEKELEVLENITQVLKS